MAPRINGTAVPPRWIVRPRERAEAPQVRPAWAGAREPADVGSGYRSVQKSGARMAEASPERVSEPQDPPGTASASPTRLLVQAGQPPGPGQMDKDSFLTQVAAAVQASVDGVLAGSPYSAASCPYIAAWLTHYHGASAEEVEAALTRYVSLPPGSTPEVAIALVAARAAAAAAAWRRRTEADPGQAAAALIDGAATSGLAALSALGAVPSPDGIAVLFAGAGDERARPTAVHAALGEGRPLGGPVRARVERALGESLEGVSLVTGPRADAVTGRLGARALTVGNRIALRADAWAPGTLEGDALLAHELAHVAQQRGGGPGAGRRTLEGEADTVAAAALTGGSARVTRGGLRLQACNETSKPEEEKPAPAPTLKKVKPASDGLHFYPGEQKVVLIKGGKEVANYPARGGPPVSSGTPVGSLPADPTRAGSFRVYDQTAYRTNTWVWSKLKWGTELQDQPKKNDVYYKLPSGKWASVSKDVGLSRDAIITANSNIWGGTGVPATWTFNDFGPKAVRYYRDVNGNGQFDDKVDELMPDMFHTTPVNEAQEAGGKPVTLEDSHGCIHLPPAARDALLKAGAFTPGQPIVIHGYDEGYDPP